MQTVVMYRVLKTKKNYDWYKNLVGKLLNEAQFEEVLFNIWLDCERIECKVRSVTPD